MLNRNVGINTEETIANRRDFIGKSGGDYNDTVYQIIEYDESQTYDKIVEVTDDDTLKFSAGVYADALIVRQPGVGLFLPVADCVATIVYDPKRQVLALLHLGRHSTLANLMRKTIVHLVEYGSTVGDLLVFMAPSIQSPDYKLDYFKPANREEWQQYIKIEGDKTSIDMQGYNREICLKMGIPKDNIEVSAANTATNSNYFSHYMGDTTDRFAAFTYFATR